MEKIINRLIGDAVVNVDKYINNGSTWLIFTESKQWVIELTKDGTLWYNYAFFKNLFAYMSMDVVENQHYITKWVDDNIINGVKINYTDAASQKNMFVQDTLQNGVKHTHQKNWTLLPKVEDAIQNGVKETKGINGVHGMDVAIQNGVKETKSERATREWKSEQVIENGVKETKHGAPDNRDYFIEDTIQNGVKETFGHTAEISEMVEHTIQNGVKDTKAVFQSMSFLIEDTIQNGIKETKDELSQRDWKVGHIIENGVKKTNSTNFEDTLKNGIKQTCAQIPSIDPVVERVVEEGIKETHDDVYHHTSRVEGVIRNGIKEVQHISV